MKKKIQSLRKKIKKFIYKLYRKIGKNSGSLYIKIVCDQTGWNYIKAKRHMDKFKKKGINYETYVTQRFYRSSKSRTERKLQLLQRKDEEYVDRVVEATGWSRDNAIKEMVSLIKNTLYLVISL